MLFPLRFSALLGGKYKPDIVSVEPRNAVVTQPTVITIKGDQLAEVSEVKVQDQPVPFTVVGDEEIRCTIPPAEYGYVDIAVESETAMSSDVIDDGFRYLSPNQQMSLESVLTFPDRIELTFSEPVATSPTAKWVLEVE